MNRSAFIFWLLLACGALLATETARTAPGLSLVHANQEVVAGERQSDIPGLAPAPEGEFFSDIAIVSSHPVVYTGLELIIQNHHGKPVQLFVHDSQGRKVLAKSFPSATGLIRVDTKNLVYGVYVYSVQIGDKLHSRSFIRSR